MTYLADYHMHSTYSTDGKSTVMALCRSAVAKGLNEIAITDHFEPNIKNPMYLDYDQAGYWADIMKARQAFKGKLVIKLGVEMGQPHLFSKVSKNQVENFPYDYVIGSVHKLPQGMDVSELDYGEWKVEDLCDMYLRQIQALLDWGDFDCVGHMDLIKRYGTAAFDKRISLASCYDLLKQTLRIIIEQGKGIEINTSGLRQLPRETMPGLDVVSLYRKLGGEILTIGSDSHHADDVGKGIMDAIDLAEAAGFTHITTFDCRKPVWHRISARKHQYGFGFI